MKLHDLITVAIAAAMGFPVQYRPLSAVSGDPDDGWIDMPDPKSFDWSGAEYRVNPHKVRQDEVPDEPDPIHSSDIPHVPIIPDSNP